MDVQTTSTAAFVATASAQDRPFWHHLLSCPGCGDVLVELAGCNSCGLVFADDSGTPILISPGLKRNVTFEFSQDRSFTPRDEIKKILRDPPFEADKSSMPYHMDPAHAHLLSRLPAGSRVLEVGCGGGQCRPWFAEKNVEYVGVDISKTRIHSWLQTYGGPDLLCDAHFLPFIDSSFDAVYSAAVTEHLACPALAAQEIFRVLKPGGHYLGNVSFLEPWHDNSYYHMSPLGVMELLRGAGFLPENIWPGRGYSGYYALCAMGFRPPLRQLKYFGQLAYLLHRGQAMTLAFARKLRNRQEVPEIFERARVAGATDWIAKRPMA